MIYPIKPILRKDWMRKDGTSKIFIQYCYRPNQRTIVDTGIAIPPQYWNKRNSKICNDLPSGYGDVAELQGLLLREMRRAEDIIHFAISNSFDPLVALKNAFKNSPGKQHGLNPKPVVPQESVVTQTREPGNDKGNMHPKANEPDVFGQFDEYLRSKEGLVKERSLQVIRTTKEHLLKFEQYRNKAITFDCFDQTFYEEFLKFLTYDIQVHGKPGAKGFKRNTVAKTIKRLKTFLHDRMRKKIIPHHDLSGYKAIEEDVDAIYVSWEEISLIYHLDLSEYPHLEKYRDLFVLGCLTGFRFCDYSEIKPEEVRNEMLYIRQCKTNESVIVPLRPDARAILIDKYQMKMPQVSYAHFNSAIKEIAKLAGLCEPIKIVHRKGNNAIQEIRPKHAWVTSHTCRRSFCTNEFLAGTPTTLIMTISGHKSEKTFMKYIKANKLQKALLIQKIWENAPRLVDTHATHKIESAARVAV